MDIERIPYEEFCHISEDWNALLALSGSDNIHLTHEWLSTWTTFFGKGKELILLKVKDDGKIIGYVPLMKTVSKLKGVIPYPRLLFLGDPESDFGDIILLRKRSEVLLEIFQYIRENVSFGEILLHTIPECSPNFGTIRNMANKNGYQFTPHTSCYFIDCRAQDWDEFYENTSKGHIKKDLKWLRNHYAKKKWSIYELHHFELDEFLYTISFLHGLSQIRKQRQSYYARDDFRGFIKVLVPLLRQRGWFRAYVLHVESRPISFVLGFEYKRIFYFWHTGFDPAYKNISPTKFLLFNILKRAFEERCWDEFNFMRGDADYKKRWTQSSYNLYQLRILNNKGLFGKLNKFRNLITV
jgi:CelD/BcsL family acetyltransferase involved in cellulose biosynthesis